MVEKGVPSAQPSSPDGETGIGADDRLASVVREGLRGKRVLLTGITGFLGTALFERLLAEFPETHIVALVRPRYASTGQARVDELLGAAAFRPLRERDGLDALRRAVADRVTVIEGDVTEEVPDLPPDLDVVFHCAASVSFDPPIDRAFLTNLLGTARLY